MKCEKLKKFILKISKKVLTNSWKYVIINTEIKERGNKKWQKKFGVSIVLEYVLNLSQRIRLRNTMQNIHYSMRKSYLGGLVKSLPKNKKFFKKAIDKWFKL